MKEYQISKNEAGQRLDKLLAKILKEAPKSFIYKMLRKKNIVLNDKKASGSEMLALGDHVKIYLSDDTFAKFSGGEKQGDQAEEPQDIAAKCGQVQLAIVYEDEDLLVINKPAGMLSQKAKADDISANEYILAYLLQSGSIEPNSLATFKPSICNRLDRNTSGLLIAGKTLRGLQYAAEILKNRNLVKIYHCVVKGTLTGEMDETAYLKKDTCANRVHVIAQPRTGYQEIHTSYRPLRSGNGFTLLEVHLHTGKTHQIRAHLAYLGHPIVGDTKYGDRETNRRVSDQFGIHCQMLHAYRLEFENGLVLTAEEPTVFSKLLQERVLP